MEPGAFLSPEHAADHVPRMPAWVTPARAGGAGQAAFVSGGALATLHAIAARAEVPHGLLRARMAMGAAENCLALTGRRADLAQLRDEWHLLRPGDTPGPAGVVCGHWQQAVARAVQPRALLRVLPPAMGDALPELLALSPHGPVQRAADVLHIALTRWPREEASALILADAVLARGLRWGFMMPLLGAGLRSGDLRQDGADLHLACHRAVVAQAVEAARMAADLTRRAARLHAALPRLRAKGAGQAAQMFLSRDALSPSVTLATVMSDRAGRRLCDRLVDLGVIREMTGRATFRLYGL